MCVVGWVCIPSLSLSFAKEYASKKKKERSSTLKSNFACSFHPFYFNEQCVQVAEAVILGGQLTTAASLNGSSGGAVTTCTFQGVHAMVVEGLGECTAPVPAGFVVA